MSEQHSDNIVCLAKASTPAQAHIWQNALEDAGIRCKTVGDYLDAGIGDIPGVRAEIWVHEEDLEKARQILDVDGAANEGDEEE